MDDQVKMQLVLEGLDRVEEGARFLKISRSRLYELMSTGELPFVKIGRSRRIPHRAIVELAVKHLCAE